MNVSRMIPLFLAAATMWLATSAGVSRGDELLGLRRSKAGLFQNYYVGPSRVGGNGAAMYPAPHPVPAWVGHTYYTHEALYPHHFMSPHMHVYYRSKGSLGLVPKSTTRALYW